MRIIAGKFRARALKSVDGPGYRPATGRVREALFSILEAGGIHWPELSVLDLFAGSGSLAFEAASRGARRICLVESSARAVECLKRNAEDLGLDPFVCRILHEDALRLLKRPAGIEERFGLVFLDPPYGRNLAPTTLRLLARGDLLMPGARIAVEIEKKDALDERVCEGELECLMRRDYGQTRIFLWQKNPDRENEHE